MTDRPLLERINSLTDAQIEDLHALFQHEWWTADRALDDVRRMITHCDYIFGYCEADSKQLVAFARVITDTVFKALVLDVIIREAYRGHGLGRRLMDDILNHPDIQRVQHLELYCLPEMMPFYEMWGFTATLGDLRFMRRTQ